MTAARPLPRPLRGFEREAAELRRRARQARQLGDQAWAMELDAAAFARENDAMTDDNTITRHFAADRVATYLYAWDAAKPLCEAVLDAWYAMPQAAREVHRPPETLLDRPTATARP